MRAIGILEVNCYEVKNYVTFGVRGFFPLASLLSHRCVANCRTIWDQEAPWGNSTIAVTDIKKGEEIFASYIRLAEPLLRQFQKDAHSRLFQLLHVLPDQEEDSVRGLVLLLLLSPVLRPHGAGHSVQHTQVHGAIYAMR